MGWQAGAVIPESMLPALAPHMKHSGKNDPAVIASSDWLVVVSQTCDVVHADLNKEPFIEVIHCKQRSDIRPEYQGRKSPRELDFKPDKEKHATVFLTVHATKDRYVVSRELFANQKADIGRQLSYTAIINIQKWYALRYTRPAWPNAFNIRLKSYNKELIKAIKPVAIDEVEIRVAIKEKDEELDVSKKYHLSVYFLVDQIFWDTDPGIRKLANTAFIDFVSILNKCSGISVNQTLSGVFAGDEFSWQMTQTTDEWNFASLSQRE